jgi:hypothetical protein
MTYCAVERSIFSVIIVFVEIFKAGQINEKALKESFNITDAGL